MKYAAKWSYIPIAIGMLAGLAGCGGGDDSAFNAKNDPLVVPSADAAAAGDTGNVPPSSLSVAEPVALANKSSGTVDTTKPPPDDDF